MDRVRTPGQGTCGLAQRVRERMAAGAAIAEVCLEDLPMWFAGQLDPGRPLAGLFRSPYALLAVYADGGRLLRAIPPWLRGLEGLRA